MVFAWDPQRAQEGRQGLILFALQDFLLSVAWIALGQHQHQHQHGRNTRRAVWCRCYCYFFRRIAGVIVIEVEK